MTAFITRMPAGIPGSYNRLGAGFDIEAGLLLSTALPIAFGVPVGIDATTGKYRGITTGDVAATVVGVLVRAYPTVNYGSLVYGGDPLGSGVPAAIGVQNIMRRGRCMVLRGGTTDAAKGGIVYVRVATPAAGKPIGGFEAAADGANTIALPGSWYWMGPCDALANGEIGINI